MAHKALHDLPFPSLPSSPPALLPVLPQGLCTCGSLCLEHSSPRHSYDWLLIIQASAEALLPPISLYFLTGFIFLYTIYNTLAYILGFPGGSDSKQSACNAEDSGSIPGSRRSPGGENGTPLQYSCLFISTSSPWTCAFQFSWQPLAMSCY